MRFMVMVKATRESEAGDPPSDALMTEMGAYNVSLVNAGVMQSGEGLQPSAKGARVRFEGDGRIVEEGPFANLNELIAGFWIFNVASMDEAIDWVKRCPNPGGEAFEFEIRQIFEPEDFTGETTPEMLEAEARLRARREGTT